MATLKSLNRGKGCRWATPIPEAGSSPSCAALCAQAGYVGLGARAAQQPTPGDRPQPYDAGCTFWRHPRHSLWPIIFRRGLHSGLRRHAPPHKKYLQKRLAKRKFSDYVSPFNDDAGGFVSDFLQHTASDYTLRRTPQPKPCCADRDGFFSPCRCKLYFHTVPLRFQGVVTARFFCPPARHERRCAAGANRLPT